MKIKPLALVLAVSGIMLVSCEKENTNTPQIDREIENAFREQYSGATRVAWDFRQGYYVADFWLNQVEAQAWYTPQAVWHMTETDVRYADLPQAVRDAFETSEYADWRIDDIDMLEHPDRETFYVIEVEQAKVEYDLYFTADGVLVKAVLDGAGTGNGSGSGNNGTGDGGAGNGNGNGGGTSHQPTTIGEAIKAWIAERYPQARIVDIENERGAIEVDIVDGRTPREVVFSSEGEWRYTETEIRQSELPATVLDALKASQYGSWRIDDVDHRDSPTGEYYLIELESGEREVVVKIDASGNILQ